MKVLIIGGNGMAGHMIKDYLSLIPSIDIYYTVRGKTQEKNGFTLDILNPHHFESLVQLLKPDAVINAAGLLNTNAEKKLQEAIYVNSLFPHLLTTLGKKYHFRTIHISTDCVFSGKKGDYLESDERDGTTVYAKTKSLGEIVDQDNVTIRTSIIGPETKKEGIGLLHWFLNQKGTIKGYRHVYWNGVTTLELAKAVVWILENDIRGLVHLTGNKKISKYQLLCLLKSQFDRDSVIIEPDDVYQSDKSLMNTRRDFAYQTPEYSKMIQELKEWMDQGSSTQYSYSQL
ncbi:dTDP-4-dehydrorhamnose reductase family protein [Bacillus massiliglaciei]|uniref:dTDP-4-dehydrorhamnose reductase family protein n=1 Tax=Bacillus massiliglaciei TaxID=1816693 RepID=UPI000B2A8186|nr:SDR family oxidoreductase [Bacillus massiliglaciei]